MPVAFASLLIVALLALGIVLAIGGSAVAAQPSAYLRARYSRPLALAAAAGGLALFALAAQLLATLWGVLP